MNDLYQDDLERAIRIRLGNEFYCVSDVEFEWSDGLQVKVTIGRTDLTKDNLYERLTALLRDVFQHPVVEDIHFESRPYGGRLITVLCILPGNLRAKRTLRDEEGQPPAGEPVPDYLSGEWLRLRVEEVELRQEAFAYRQMAQQAPEPEQKLHLYELAAKAEDAHLTLGVRLLESQIRYDKSRLAR
jgi:hypothetical protein